MPFSVMGVCLNKGRKVSESLDEEGRFRSEWEKGVTASEAMLQNGHAQMSPPSAIQFTTPTTPVIFVLGGPGSGKITHCDHAVHDRPGLVHINMTDLLQQHVVGNELRDFAQIPARTVSEVLMMEMNMAMSSKGFVVSGYPRNMRDVVEYSEKLQRVDGVILLDWHEKILEKQIEYGANLGAIVLDLARMELKNYKKNVRPVAEFYDHRGMLHLVNGERHPDDVYSDLLRSIDDILQNAKNRPPEDMMPIKKEPPPKPITKTDIIKSIPMPSKSDIGSESTTPPVLWVMGGPGSNKGLLCKRVAALHPGWVHLSVGELLRKIVDQSAPSSLAAIAAIRNDQGQRIRGFVLQGELVPQDMVLKILGAQMAANNKAEGFIIDGFPRDFNQMQTFETLFQQEPPLVLVDCSELELGRNLGQRVASEQRIDDRNPAAVRRRLQLYREVTLPMLKSLDEKSRLIIVDGDMENNQVASEFKRAVGTVTGLLRATRNNKDNPFGQLAGLANGSVANLANGVGPPRKGAPGPVPEEDFGPRMPVLNQSHNASNMRAGNPSADTLAQMYNDVEQYPN